MLIPSMEISCLMVHDELIEKQKLKHVIRELNMTKAEDQG